MANQPASKTEKSTVDSRLKETARTLDLETLRRLLESHSYAGALHTDLASLTVYSTDNSIYQVRPAAVAVPSNSDDIQILARCNNKLAEPFPLTARGGGTGTNGQSLTNGIIVDTKRKCRRIISVDPDNYEAVVEPGVVLDELNDLLDQHNLFFAPHVSTSSRATIGGMVATDAAGKGSMIHGRTNDHILAVNAVLADGTAVCFNSPEQTSDYRSGDEPKRLSTLYDSVDEALKGVEPKQFPSIERGFTGYNLADASHEHGADITKLICGSEGTLALIQSIRIKLTTKPNKTHLAVVGYQSFAQAIEASIELKKTDPSAIECLDERTIELARTSPSWQALRASIDNADPRPKALLLLEYTNDAGPAKLQAFLTEVTEVSVSITDAPNEIANIWKIRKDAVGLLGQQVDGHRAVPFVEDCAVPPNRMPEFVRDFRQLLDDHGLSYGMFGHADVGCVHVRPALDLYTDEHQLLVRTISDAVADLVAGYDGVLWGEHGRGFRGEYANLPTDLHHRMRQVKTAFDPKNILNPHKLYTPLPQADRDPDETVVKIDRVPLRASRDRATPQPMLDEFDSAFACNGNGICHHWGDAEVMCPSYKVTLDPRLSPKGRSDMLRAWAADPEDEALRDDLSQSLNACLSCSACTGRCPVSVDIPELKSRFFNRHPDSALGQRFRHRILGAFESLLPALRRLGAVGLATQRWSAPLVERSLGMVDLPPLASLDRDRFAELGVPILGDSKPPDGTTVVILPDAFNLFFEPAVLEATAVVLLSVGERPAIGPFVPSGKYYHVKGFRNQFRDAVDRQRQMIEEFDQTDLDLVAVEPAVQLLYSREYREIDPGFPSDRVSSLPAYLSSRVDNLTIAQGSTDIDGRVTIFGHCTETSLAPSNNQLYQQILSQLGLQADFAETTCCGMAGIFGHERENQQLSKDLFDQFWLPKIEAVSGYTCAPGYSCRSQAKRFGAGQLIHPIQILAQIIDR